MGSGQQAETTSPPTGRQTTQTSKIKKTAGHDTAGPYAENLVASRICLHTFCPIILVNNDNKNNDNNIL